jgi:GNAT superfamily N-acetyltransferase
MSGAAPAISLVEGGAHPGREVILAGLRRFNADTFGVDSGLHPFTVFAHDASGAVAGGLIAQLSYSWLYVDKLWLPPSMRGHGTGGAVLDTAERFAVERGCGWAHLQTLDFQGALPFYERRGYAVFGVLEGYPPGSRRYYLRKTLAPATA